MLDIQFIRENADLVKQKSQQKGYAVDIDQLLELDRQRRELIQKRDELRAQLNKAAEQFKAQLPSEEQRDDLKNIKRQLAELEATQAKIDGDYLLLLKAVPNMPLDDVPVGANESENQVVKEAGRKRQFDFQPLTHAQLGIMRGLIDKQRAAKVAGARFAYLKDGLVELHFAIIQYVLHTVGDESVQKKLIHQNNLNIEVKPFRPILPPYMLRTEVYDAMDRLEPRDDRYRVGEDQDNLWLEGSAEHTLGPMYMNEVLQADSLPLRFIGYATSFRREAGSYGKDTEGIIRMHQFDKLEMEVFSTAATGRDEHLLLVAIQEYLVQQLGLPYRVLLKCTADIGKPNARGVDLEVWMPGENRYLETHTADYMTDYQARRLNTRTRIRRQQTGLATEQLQLIHTNDATAFALGRIIAAIMENYQQADGRIIVPDIIRPFMGGKEEL